MSSRRMPLVGALLLALVPAMPRASEPGSPPQDVPVAGVEPGIVDGVTARRLVASGIKVVDVRTPAEFSAGHVPGAVNIPYDEMAARHAELGPSSTPVLLYCKTGRRTELAARALREAGFSTIYDMQSYDRWAESAPKK